MYGAGDALPAVYTERFRTQIYNDRITHPGAWNKVVVVAREDDDETMLNHAPDPEPTALPDLAPQPPGTGHSNRMGTHPGGRGFESP